MASVEVLEVPDKPQTDRKSYRVIKLPNGLKALLISTSGQKNGIVEPSSYDKKQKSDSTNKNSETNWKLAACSLMVDVGSQSDPPDVQGLSHFLEHMVFMGSEKYPGENEFGQFMQQSGGESNARTELDDTCFYFLTNEQFLDEALDRFSQFFKTPLILKEAMTREREAIESEFYMVKDNEVERQNHLLASIGQPGHPIKTFSWGNLKTLKDNIDDDVLYQKVHEFRKRHYSAHRMYVCVQSQSTLDELQEMVTRHFSNVPTNNLPGDDFSAFTHQNAFQSKFYEKVYFVKPISNICRVDITWCMEPMIQKFKCKPDIYVSNVIGNEGHGSLLSYLRKQLWATELLAGPDVLTSLYTLFKINVSLTELGFDHLDDVLGAIFSYLKLMQLSDPKESIFRELQTIRSNEFRFANEYEVSMNVSARVKGLKQYPPKYILSGDNQYFEYDPNEMQKFIDELNSRQFNIMITSARRYNEQVTFEMIEPWFGTEYTELDMPTKWISSWENAKPFPEFSMPEPNPFIANDFTIWYNNSIVLPKYPTKILDNDLCELWFRQDDKFLLPNASYNFYFMTPLANASIDNMILMKLMTVMLKHQFIEKLYPATVAGLKYQLLPSDIGLIFTVEGFNQKLHLVVEEFCRCLKSLADDSTEEQFNVFVQQLHKAYENSFLPPISLSKELHLNVIDSQHQPFYLKYDRLKSIKFADFQQFCRDICKQLRIRALIQGNITEERAQNIMQNVLNEMNCSRINDMSSMELRASKLPVGANYLRCKSFNPKDANSIIINYYQIGPNSYHTKVLIDLLVRVGTTPLFDTLRTNEQLAYYVAFEPRNNYGILGYSILVNSQETKFTAEHVDERIEKFRGELKSIIEKMSDDDFNTLKSSVAKNKLSDCNDLNEEVGQNWIEIEIGEYEFDRLEKEAEHLAAITKDQLLEFYNEHFGENERKLSIQVIGNVEDREDRRMRFDNLSYVQFKNEPKGNLITDLMEFRNGLEVYSISKI